jgi:hypothetical protein
MEFIINKSGESYSEKIGKKTWDFLHELSNAIF